MALPDRRARPGRAGALAVALLGVDVPSSSREERLEVARYVEESVALMPDWTRLGVRTSAVLATAVLALRSRGRLDRLDDRRRGELVAGLAEGSLPLVGEVARACRSLALVGLYSARSGEER